MSDQFLSLDADCYQKWADSGLTWVEWRQREIKRRRLMRRAGYLAGVILSVILAWVAVGMAVAR